MYYLLPSLITLITFLPLTSLSPVKRVTNGESSSYISCKTFVNKNRAAFFSGDKATSCPTDISDTEPNTMQIHILILENVASLYWLLSLSQGHLVIQTFTHALSSMPTPYLQGKLGTLNSSCKMEFSICFKCRGLLMHRQSVQSPCSHYTKNILFVNYF